jgi:carboxyl-terminal processing protease
LIKNDSLLDKKREIWHKELDQDIYVEEALNILESLQVKPSFDLGLVKK